MNDTIAVTDRPLNRTMLVIAVISVTLMQMLDTTIVNVALPQMQGQLGATSSEISWVLTSYIVSATVFMPLTGYFTDRLGQRRYLVTATAGFVASSVLCGLAFNLSEIVIFRIAQGISGAALVPLSQTIMTGLYPPEQRGRAMALWGLGVTLGPVLGPTLGGWLTEVLSWRWTFFINLPVGIISILMIMRYLPKSAQRERTMDWNGFVLLGLAVGSLQFALDRGNKVDWFEAPEIVLATVLCVISLSLFIRHLANGSQHPIFDPRIFKDMNFALATTMITALSLFLFSAMILQPILMESLLGYPVSTTGLMMTPRGIAVGIGMIIVGRLADRMDLRILVLTGMTCMFSAAVWMSTYTLEIDQASIVLPGLIQGVGMALIMVPLSVYAYTTLPRFHMAEAAGMSNLIRNLGSSIGISLTATYFARFTQQGWQQLGAYTDPLSPGVRDYLQHLHLTPENPLGSAVLAMEVGKQAAIAAMAKVFLSIAVLTALLMPFVFALRAPNRAASTVPTQVPVD